MRDTSSTVKGRSSTWANPWSTSSRCVSGSRKSWRTTSRRRTRTTVRPLSSPWPATTAQYATDLSNPVSPHHLLSNQILALLWSAAPACAKRGLGPQPLSSPRAAAGQKDKINLRLCYWNIWTITPSGGQIEDQHNVHWAMRLHPKPGTLIWRFAAQNPPLWRSVHYVEI